MNESELWNKLREGDNGALERIYKNHFRDLYDYGKRFSADEATIEDCIQELFIDIWNTRQSIGPTDAIKPYLMTSLRRKIIKTVKSNRKTTDVELKETHFETELDMESLFINSEEASQKKSNLSKAFNQLSDRQKEILYLKYYANLSYKDIAQQMDINYQSTRNLVHRAISKLSELFVIILILIVFQ